MRTIDNIIDAHAHTFDRVRGLTGAGITEPLPLGKVRLGNRGVMRLMPPLAINTSFPPEALLEYMDWAGVEKAVLLQAPLYGELNQFVYLAVNRWPDRFWGAACVDPWSKDALRTFSQVVNDLGFRAIKLEMSESLGLLGIHNSIHLDDEQVEWFWEESEKKQLIITLDLGPIGGSAYQTDALKNVLSHHPNLIIVIAHLAQPPIKAEKDCQMNRLWQEQVSLARHPNVWLDLAALPSYEGEGDYPYPRASNFIRQAIELVGSDKIIWGSDIPGMLAYATYEQLINYIVRYCDFLSEADRSKIFGDNALQIYSKPLIV
jgi:predicted TIM-barrel fold metal-dependent hydrolase